MQRSLLPALVFSLCWFVAAVAEGQTLEKRLRGQDPAALAAAARKQGDAQRGAIVFYQPHMACTKCHAVDGKQNALGPDLTKLGKDATDVHLVESVLLPTKAIRKGYDSVTVVTAAGKTIIGLVVKETGDQLVLRDIQQNGRVTLLRKKDIVQRAAGKKSIMPEGQVNQLASRQQFLDLVRFLIEIRDGGLTRARQLQPPPWAYAVRIPEYEKRIDHAGMIAGFDSDGFKRGQAIYNRLCINCHGTHDKPGSLPTSLRFAAGKFKNGNDPFTMYQTLTRGFGMMTPQTWMAPQQKYDVIHYVREAYLKRRNHSQYFKIEDGYLAGLPKGDTRGPKPTNIQPWINMNYGVSLVNTYEIGSDGTNFAYKGIAVRLDPGPGGVSRGNAWMIFDHDTMRMAAAWTGSGFIDFNGIHFNGRHNTHPRIAGQVHLANPTGPGWANPATGGFVDDLRVEGRDGRRYGPLPKPWARYRGLYHHGQQVVVAYAIGETEVLEKPGLLTTESGQVFTRTFNIAPRKRPMTLQIARHPARTAQLHLVRTMQDKSAIAVLAAGGGNAKPAAKIQKIAFDGGVLLDIAKPGGFDLTDRDYTIAARIKTRKGGTIFCKTDPGDKWARDCKSLFVRGGRLCFDIGWVGAVATSRRVNDDRWHNVAMSWKQKTAEVRLYIDGKLDARGQLRPKQTVKGHAVRIGYSAPDFPRPDTFFVGDIKEVRFYQSLLNQEVIARLNDGKEVEAPLTGHWRIDAAKGPRVADLAKRGHDGLLKSKATASQSPAVLVAGMSPHVAESTWLKSDAGDLRLRIPPGDKPLKFTLWMASINRSDQARAVADAIDLQNPDVDLEPLTHGGPPRWPQRLKTEAVIGESGGPFAVDVLTHPVNNPWMAQMRLTGFDFFPDGDRAAVCTWDGDVWLVRGLNSLPAAGPKEAGRKAASPPTLEWQRIASGLFQPLGVKIVRGQIYVTCRDQLVVLHDRNGDGETDYYQCFNNDHQVTEHFHEFAMGLQTDAEGNFYYAKSARHAKKAIVPHHGTLLRISPDGARTDILATGFRAANGVCLNPDGTFFVTDQEGHWMPKNRINWVKDGGFYGNMFGYHDVTDTSDAAMIQPLCWITNKFDRSPAELLWVEGDKWGPLKGTLLNLSYGYGKIYTVPHEKIDGQMQGGVSPLPLPQFPTGAMRARFHPKDGQLYTSGMFAWAGSQQQPGGFYRVRYTGKPLHVATKLHARTTGMAITFSGALDREWAQQAGNFSVKTWSLKRTANYGSKHYDERKLNINAARISADRRTVFLDIPEIQPTWCMEIRYSLKTSAGGSFRGVIHNTIHKLAK